jgi:wyosine [tRNA(Phe)-imidazoG37] synthetase (radical SAM superfamily)
MAHFVYGPVPSRRLGRSLGVDIVTLKNCTQNCVYCQLGSAPVVPPKRKIFADPILVEKEIKEAVEKNPQLDYITLSGSGEPTLSLDLGRIINFAKSLNVAPVCVLTNGTLLWDAQVRKELSNADLVVPSLDAADEETFRKVNRTENSISFGKYLGGLKKFREEFNGKFHIEILLVEGLNDSDEHLRKLAEIVREISPDGIWIGTISRPPAEKTAKPVSEETLEKARIVIGEKARIIEKFEATANEISREKLADDVFSILKRRPETIAGISKSLGANPNEVLRAINLLYKNHKISPILISGETFYEPKKSSNKK